MNKHTTHNLHTNLITKSYTGLSKQTHIHTHTHEHTHTHTLFFVWRHRMHAFFHFKLLKDSIVSVYLPKTTKMAKIDHNEINDNSLVQKIV